MHIASAIAGVFAMRDDRHGAHCVCPRSPTKHQHGFFLSPRSVGRGAFGPSGIDASRITAIGKGESNLTATNGSAAGRVNNRRIEVTILDNAKQ